MPTLAACVDRPAAEVRTEDGPAAVQDAALTAGCVCISKRGRVTLCPPGLCMPVAVKLMRAHPRPLFRSRVFSQHRATVGTTHGTRPAKASVKRKATAPPESTRPKRECRAAAAAGPPPMLPVLRAPVTEDPNQVVALVLTGPGQRLPKAAKDAASRSGLHKVVDLVQAVESMTPWEVELTYGWNAMQSNATQRKDQQEAVVLYSRAIHSTVTDHFQMTSSKATLDSNLLYLFSDLIDCGALPVHASTDEWYRFHEQGPLRPDPTSPSDWGMPALLASLAPPSNSLQETEEPPGMGLPLFPYQRQALTWMLRQEMPTEAPKLLSPMWRAVRAAGKFVTDAGDWSVPPGSNAGEVLYQNVRTGQLSRQKPAAPSHTLLRGGILADAPGLGKTAELAALILAHPFDPAKPDKTANGQTMRERGVEHLVTRVKTTLVVVTDSIYRQWIGELQRFAPGLTVAAFPDDVPGLAALMTGHERRPGNSGYDADVAKAVRCVEDLDVLVITYGGLSHLRKGPVCAALRDKISWWRVVLDEAQTCFNATSSAAQAVSHLWKNNVWCTTGTPIGHTAKDLHGLFEILDSDPYASEPALNAFIVEPYLKREPGSYGRMHALLRSVMLRREADHPHVVAATSLARPVWISPVLRLSPPEAARYQAAYQMVFRRADAELARLHARELQAENQLRGGLTSTTATEVREAQKALDMARVEAIKMQMGVYLAQASARAGASEAAPQADDAKSAKEAKAEGKAQETAAKTAAEAAIDAYLAIPVRTRLYNSSSSDGEPLVADRDEEEAPDGAQVGVIAALCPGARLALEGAALAVWNAQQGAMTVAQLISDGEASRQPDKWMTALTNALDYLQRLGGEDDVEDDEGEGPSEEQAARARRRQLRRARAALLTGRGGDEAEGVRGTAGLREAVMALRRMVNHPSLEGPSLCSRQQGGEAGSSKATVQQKSFAVMLDEAQAAVRELEEKLATVATADKEAAKEKVGKKGSSRNASEAQYITLRLSAARKRLELLREAVAGQAGSVCPICLESPGEGDLTKGVIALPCLHPACQPCLAEWMHESMYSGCPVCRQPVKNTVTLFAATQVVHRSNTATAALDAKAAEMAKAAAAATVSPDVLQHGAKLAWLLHDIAQRQAAGGSNFRCVVFSAWETVLAVVAEALRGRGITCAEGFAPPGMQPSAGRSHAEKEINKFKGGAITVLLLPLRGAAKSAAAGLNLQEASVAYLFDPSTSRALEEQAVARISRIGQTAQVVVVRMCLSQTLDEDVVLLQQKLGAGRGGAAADEFVSGEDLAMLFGISAMRVRARAVIPAAH